MPQVWDLTTALERGTQRDTVSSEGAEEALIATLDTVSTPTAVHDRRRSSTTVA